MPATGPNAAETTGISLRVSATDLNLDFLDVPIFCIFYDLIPLLNPESYLTHNPDFSKYYYEKIKNIIISFY